MKNKKQYILEINKIINFLIYDGDCPFCNFYISKIRLTRALEIIEFINARETPELVNELFIRGYDVNTGMILAIDGHYYHGADCMWRLVLMTTSSSYLNTIIALLFKRPKLAKLLYPILVTGRDLILLLLRRTKIRIK